MEKIQFKAKLRKETGKGSCYRIRQTGFIPGILYGAEKENVLIALEKKTTEKDLKTVKGHSVIADLVIEDNGKGKSYKTIVKEIQYNPITRDIFHIDFNLIRSDKAIVMQVPLNFIGDCPGVKEGGILEHHLWELKIEGMPDKIPDSVTVDLSTLEIGKSIFVKEISVPEGIKIVTESERPVITVSAPKAEEVPVPAAVVAEEVTQPEVITQEIAEERRKEKEVKKSEKIETEKKEEKTEKKTEKTEKKEKKE